VGRYQLSCAATGSPSNEAAGVGPYDQATQRAEEELGTVQERR